MMAAVGLRQRAGYLFLAVILGHVILISAQVNTRSGIPVLEAVTFGIFAQVQRGVSTGVSTLRRVWSRYIWLRGVEAENELLRRQLADLRVEFQKRQALADRAGGLARLLELRGRADLDMVGASVIAASAAPDFRTLTIDKGIGDGLRPDMAVIAPRGVVGRIVVPTARAAKVQLVIDRNAAAGAIIERSRAQGVVVGTGEARLHLEYLSETADVTVGDRVVTSGIDGIFPKGFAIGQIDKVDRNGSAYRRITVRPAVDFSTLEDVLVVLTPTPLREATGGDE
jgi:rod shape-determining protein MreC